MTGKDESILMSIPMLDSIFPQLTNQQFINCAFLEISLDRTQACVLLPVDSLSHMYDYACFGEIKRFQRW